MASIPELAVLSDTVSKNNSAAAQEPKKVMKRIKKKKLRKRSRLSQLCGMSDREKSSWMLEHCKVAKLRSIWHCHVLAASGTFCQLTHLPVLITHACSMVQAVF